MSSTLGAALYYATEKQWPVVPVWPIRDGECLCGNPECTRKGKHPITKYNGNEIAPKGILDATTDEGKIRQWWGYVRDANIGIRGEKFFAIDVDEEEAYFELISRYERLPDTIESISGSGGRHILFKQPPGSILGNERGDIPKGIDIRGKNGYIIAPPSVHQSGRRYEWEASSHPRDTELADAPEWLIKAITANSQAAAQVQFEEVDAPELATIEISQTTKTRILNAPPDGVDRSELDMQVACALADAGCDASQIRAIFAKYPIGTQGKYSERGDVYLERTIGKALAWAKPNQGKKVQSKIVPGKEVTQAEARIEQAALSIAYQQGWNDALVSNQNLIPQMWPQYLGITGGSIAYYGIGMRTDYHIGEADFPALVIPYYTHGNVTTLDYTLYGQPQGSPSRLWETVNNTYVFDTDTERTGSLGDMVLVTEDWDTAMYTYLKHSPQLKGLDIIGQPAARAGSEGKLARLRALASYLGQADRILLAWPRQRKPEAVILAKLLDNGGERVKWISTPVSLREMYREYDLGVNLLRRYMDQAASII